MSGERRPAPGRAPHVGPRLRQFFLGVAAGLVAQALWSLWHWLREPALRR